MDDQHILSRRTALKLSFKVPAAIMLGCDLLSHRNSNAAEPTFKFGPVEEILHQAVHQKAFPGCSAAFGNSEAVLWSSGFGHLSLSQNKLVTPSTPYDLASLTKIVGTTSVAIQLLTRESMTLNDPVTKWIPEFLSKNDDSVLREEITIRHLLTHTSGLPAWKPIYKSASNYQETIQTICQTDLEQPPGEKYRYSDLGMMLLGETLSRTGKAPLAKLEHDLVFKPLGMKQTLRNPPKTSWSKIAPTERIGESKKFYQGVVHDENARGGEGLTGHAGLFSNLVDLSRFSQAWLKAVRGNKSLFDSTLARQFASPQKIPGDSRRGLGWQMFSPGGSGGTLLSASAFGHTGFTGTSLWIDPEKDLFLILLSNRVHPTRKNSRHLAVRREFADAIVRAVEQS
ncbi:beta-lactamase family protein [Planctomycetaceae bacterium]|nr:beta-lactamase family protein [Planctomycetaceae bacterium]